MDLILIWLVTTYIPMPALFRTIILVVVVIVLVLFLIRRFGGGIPNVM